MQLCNLQPAKVPSMEHVPERRLRWPSVPGGWLEAARALLRLCELVEDGAQEQEKVKRYDTATRGGEKTVCTFRATTHWAGHLALMLSRWAD